MELLVLTIILVLISVLALSVRLLFAKKGEFRGGSCGSYANESKNPELTCGCPQGEHCKTQ